MTTMLPPFRDLVWDLGRGRTLLIAYFCLIEGIRKRVVNLQLRTYNERSSRSHLMDCKQNISSTWDPISQQTSKKFCNNALYLRDLALPSNAITITDIVKRESPSLPPLFALPGKDAAESIGRSDDAESKRRVGDEEKQQVHSTTEGEGRGKTINFKTGSLTEMPKHHFERVTPLTPKSAIWLIHNHPLGMTSHLWRSAWPFWVYLEFGSPCLLVSLILANFLSWYTHYYL